MARIDSRVRRRARRAWRVCLLLFGGASAQALAPHEVAVLINAASPASLEVANHYCAARQIPLANRVVLNLPPEALAPAAEITPAEFRSLIWEPTIAHLREQRLFDHVLAWVYSVDFPVRLRMQPAMSIQGLTLLRGQPAAAEVLNAAQYVNPYYAGPDEPGGAQRPSRSISLRYFHTLEEVAVPSFSLGHIRSRGVRVEQVLENIERSAAADHTAPDAAVLFVTNEDIRSTARAWQYAGATDELRAMGRTAEITPLYPQKYPRLLGILTGSVRAKFPGKGRLVPGALADHLTSHAANFDAPMQGKISDWLRWGATASAGAVTEPFALWPKFPHARLYAHYAAGATVLESYYQAVRCPLQLYLAGDPLCAPYAPDLRLSVTATPTEDPPMLRISSHLVPAPQGGRMEYSLYLNDELVLRHVPVAPTRFSLQGLADGVHHVRLVAEIEAPVRHHATGETTFTLARRGRSVRLQPQPEPLGLLLDRTVLLPFQAEGEPKRVALYSGRRLLSAVDSGEEGLPLDPRLLGEGPNEVHPVAEYENGERVAGPGLSLRIRAPEPPVIRRVPAPQADTEHGALLVESPAAVIRSAWFRRLDPLNQPASFVSKGGRLAAGDGAVVLQASGRAAVCTEARPPRGPAPEAFRVDLRIPVLGKDTLAGLAFNVRSERHFDFFGLHGGGSGWVLASVSPLRTEIHHAVGDPLDPGRWVDLHVRQTPGGVEGLVDGQVVCRWPEGRLERRESGLMARAADASFRNWMESMTLAFTHGAGEAGSARPVVTNQPLAWVVWDGFTFAWQALDEPNGRGGPTEGSSRGIE